VAGHGANSLGAVYRERLFSAHHPRREDQIRVSGGVIGMQMGDEGGRDPDRIERVDPLELSRLGAADDSRAEVDQLSRSVDHDCRGGGGPVGFDSRRAGAEENDLRSGRLLRGRGRHSGSD